MKSIAFPNIIGSQKTNIIEDHEATYSNLRLMLLSYKQSLLGDPFFGTNLVKLLYSQGSVILKDILIDEIYESIVIFMPQIIISRNDIDIIFKEKECYITLRCTNLIDYVTDLYEISLTSNE